jgi:hypothetical protein
MILYIYIYIYIYNLKFDVFQDYLVANAIITICDWQFELPFHMVCFTTSCLMHVSITTKT